MIEAVTRSYEDADGCHNNGVHKLHPGDDVLARIKGESNAMERVKCAIRKFARFPGIPVLVTGETGTGKELVVDALHACSPRATKPLIKVNCAAIPENLLESHLFGHVKGAFSGAYVAKQGLIETAEGGTLVLDEVGSLKLDLQPKLLRFLETGVFHKVGGELPTCTDVWVISATNDDLQQRVLLGEFRQDLYYRLRSVELQVPPLRERAEDIVPLAMHFLEQLAMNYGVPVKRLSPRSKMALTRPVWPGNVRELKQLMFSLGISVEGAEIMPRHVQKSVDVDARPEELLLRVVTLAELERTYLARLMEATSCSLSDLASILGLNRKTLRRKLRAHDIEVVAK